MNFAVIDIVFASVILILVVRCALRGFVEEFLSMAALVAGGLCAFFFFRPGAEFVRNRLGITILPELVAAVGLFLIAFILVKLLESILLDIVDRINLTGVDRALGLVLGAVEGLLLVSAALFLLSVQPLFDTTQLLSGSLFAKYLMPFVTMAGQTAAAAVKGS